MRPFFSLTPCCPCALCLGLCLSLQVLITTDSEGQNSVKVDAPYASRYPAHGYKCKASRHGQESTISIMHRREDMCRSLETLGTLIRMSRL